MPPASRAPDEPLRILVVCSANICRSPMAAALLGWSFARRRIPLDVRSAGFLGEGMPASDTAVAVMAERGLDISAHRSRLVDPDLVRDVDLVLAMERRHVHDLLALAGPACPMFPLRTFVRRAAGVDPAGRTQRQWLAAVAAAQPVTVSQSRDDVTDPHGRPIELHRRTADLLAAAAGALAALAGAADGE